ncbi:MerR family DNA-binding transcriptional regulator [Pseudonocardia sp. HH130630-07]|uniref:MerR family DNA-binding transcriptional regulator n=1 Tax=Pseudonocardia sp. HH130630-07 TaxID=1690815 RepID=UPI000839CAAE|nr:MerR family DNA-binding transcriptional regulator [Pseudonocardia sp. HH130630-07]
MAWSTREIAELAGTSVRAVRHYHEIGLLPEPGRRPNGYKQYGADHLIRLLRITRLTALGFPLSRIPAEDDSGAPDTDAALRTLDTELAATLDRLHRTRAELAAILRHETAVDLPPEFRPATGVRFSDATRATIAVLARTLPPRDRAAYGAVLRGYRPDPTDREFEDLPDDAGVDARQDLAERMARHVRALYASHPELVAPHRDAPVRDRAVARTAAVALRGLCRPVQRDVLRRLGRELHRDPVPGGEPHTPGDYAPAAVPAGRGGAPGGTAGRTRAVAAGRTGTGGPPAGVGRGRAVSWATRVATSASTDG